MAKTVKLPWRPVAQLPCQPNPDREFLITGYADGGSAVVQWDSVRGHWRSGSEGLFDDHVREDFTHFLEVTPP